MEREEFITKAVATVLYCKEDNDFLQKFLNVDAHEIVVSSNGWLYEITGMVYNQMSDEELIKYEKELEEFKC